MKKYLCALFGHARIPSIPTRMLLVCRCTRCDAEYIAGGH